LQAAKEYALGLKVQTRAGESFIIPAEPLMDMATYERFLQVREANVKHPTGHLKRDYLIGGLLYCACNHKWRAWSNSNRRRNRHGKWVERKTRTGVYSCSQLHPEHVSPDCPRYIGSKKADDDV